MIIILLGILAIVVLPSFNSGPFLSRGFHDDVLSAARHAQKLAVASGCPARLSVAGSSYALEQSADCGSAAWDVPVRHPARPGNYAGTAPSGVALAGGNVVFFADGSSTGGSVSVDGRSFDVLSTGHVRQN